MISHPRKNKTKYDPQSCLTARINVTLMIRLVLNGSSFFRIVAVQTVIRTQSPLRDLLCMNRCARINNQ